MQKYTIYLPDDVIREIDAEVLRLRENKPANMPHNIGRGTVITQAWQNHKLSKPTT